VDCRQTTGLLREDALGQYDESVVLSSHGEEQAVGQTLEGADVAFESEERKFATWLDSGII
jgi:hypothetical protein